MARKLTLKTTSHHGRYAVTDRKGRVVCYMTLKEARRYGLSPEQ